MLVRYISAFLLMLLIDYTWGLYIRFVAEGRAVGAALVSAVIFLFGGYITVQYIDDPWVLIPAAIGGTIGTYLSVRKSK